MGLYSVTIAEQNHTYVRPQENGKRTDVRWVALINQSGARLLAIGQTKPLNFSAWTYSIDDLEVAQHSHELPHRDTITLNLDHRQMGVGGDTSWRAETHPEYTLPSRSYSFPLRLAALLADDGGDTRQIPRDGSTISEGSTAVGR